jgi:hypothetical protein
MTARPPIFQTSIVKRVVVQIRFAEAGGEQRPVAASTRRGGTGARVTLEVEREAVDAGAIHVLYRAGAAGLVIAGSVCRDRVHAALAALGDAGAAYRIACIPLETLVG